MSAEQETEDDDDNRIFPILDRETPLIDRIRERRNNGADTDDLSFQIARSALTGEPVNESFLLNLKQDIADELEISENRINDMFISRVRDTLSPSLDELVSETSVEESSSQTENQSDDRSDEDTESSSDNQSDQESEEDDSGSAFPSESEEEDEDGESEAEEIF